MLDALVLVLARVQFYDQSGVSTLESGFREDHCSEGPGPGFGKCSELGKQWPNTRADGAPDTRTGDPNP